MLAVKITDNDETVEIVDLPGYAAKFADLPDWNLMLLTIRT